MRPLAKDYILSLGVSLSLYRSCYTTSTTLPTHDLVIETLSLFYRVTVIAFDLDRAASFTHFAANRLVSVL